MRTSSRGVTQWRVSVVCAVVVGKHLLINCSVAFELWSLTFRVFGVQWVLPKKVLDLFYGWQSRGPNLDI